MRTKTYILAALVALTFAQQATAKKKTQSASVYIFGFATCFQDSTVWLSDIQQLDSAYVLHNGFLFGRDQYTYQMHDKLAASGVYQPACATFYATTRKKAEKKYVALRKKYTKEKEHYEIKYITAAEFQYQSIRPDAETLKQENMTKAERKAAKKAAKLQKKANKDSKRPAGNPPAGGRPQGPPPTR